MTTAKSFVASEAEILIFPRKSEEREQKFQTDNVSIPRFARILLVTVIGRTARKICFNCNSIKSATQIWLVTRHQYGISALISQTSFRGETSGYVAKCRLFSHMSR